MTSQWLTIVALKDLDGNVEPNQPQGVQALGCFDRRVPGTPIS